jgi:acyl carrier protein
MERNSVLKQINEMFKVLRDRKTIQLADVTIAAGKDRWNSQTHIELMDAIEKHFDMRFSLNKIGPEFRNQSKK